MFLIHLIPTVPLSSHFTQEEMNSEKFLKKFPWSRCEDQEQEELCDSKVSVCLFIYFFRSLNTIHVQTSLNIFWLLESLT